GSAPPSRTYIPRARGGSCSISSTAFHELTRDGGPSPPNAGHNARAGGPGPPSARAAPPPPPAVGLMAMLGESLPLASNRQPSGRRIGAILGPCVEGNRRAGGSLMNGVDDSFEYRKTPGGTEEPATPHNQ